MSTSFNQFINDLDVAQNLDFRPTMRAKQIKIKLKRSELQDYDIKQMIGQGGYGEVKKAVHRLTGQIVAIKIFSLQQYDPEGLAMIQKEIQNQKVILHENIVQIYQVIKKDSKVYIVMEYCKNGQLFDRINRNGALPQRQAIKIFNQICQALLYLKSNNLSHRDIKPQNVLFDENWKVKLIDFGFSCFAQVGQFRKTVCGTPSYTPPQMLKNLSYDAQLADVWSLGVTLYAMLAAKLPFDGQTVQKKKANILALRYAKQPNSSAKAQKLFASIFVDAKYRPKLIDLKMSQFAQSFEPYRPNFIDFRKEELVIQDEVIKVIEDYNIDPRKVMNSVKNHKFDKYHALYYLTIKNQKRTHIHIQNDNYLNQFKKRKKNSKIKLQPINTSRTPSVKNIPLVTKKSKTIQSPKGNNKLSEIKSSRRKSTEPNINKLRRSVPLTPRRPFNNPFQSDKNY